MRTMSSLVKHHVVAPAATASTSNVHAMRKDIRLGQLYGVAANDPMVRRRMRGERSTSRKHKICTSKAALKKAEQAIRKAAATCDLQAIASDLLCASSGYPSLGPSELRDALKRSLNVNINLSESASLAEEIGPRVTAPILLTRFLKVARDGQREEKERKLAELELYRRRAEEYVQEMDRLKSIRTTARVEFCYTEEDMDSGLEKLRSAAAAYDRARRGIPNAGGLYDTGELNPSQFKELVYRRLGMRLTPSELGALFCFFDADASGTVDSTEFLIAFRRIADEEGAAVRRRRLQSCMQHSTTSLRAYRSLCDSSNMSSISTAISRNRDQAMNRSLVLTKMYESDPSVLATTSLPHAKSSKRIKAPTTCIPITQRKHHIRASTAVTILRAQTPGTHKRGSIGQCGRSTSQQLSTNNLRWVALAEVLNRCGLEHYNQAAQRFASIAACCGSAAGRDDWVMTAQRFLGGVGDLALHRLYSALDADEPESGVDTLRVSAVVEILGAHEELQHGGRRKLVPQQALALFKHIFNWLVGKTAPLCLRWPELQLVHGAVPLPQFLKTMRLFGADAEQSRSMEIHLLEVLAAHAQPQLSQSIERELAVPLANSAANVMRDGTADCYGGMTVTTLDMEEVVHAPEDSMYLSQFIEHFNQCLLRSSALLYNACSNAQ